MKSIRLFLYLIVGFLLGGLSVASFAGSVPAKSVYSVGGVTGTSPSSLCSPKLYRSDSSPYWWSGTYYIGYCYYIRESDGVKFDVGQVSAGSTCEGIGGTLEGKLPNAVCTCPDPQVPQGGVCVTPKPDHCAPRAGKFFNGGLNPNGQIALGDLVGGDTEFSGKSTPPSDSVPSLVCVDDCQADPRASKNFSGATFADGSWIFYGNPQFNGKQCGVSSSTPEPTSKPIPKDSEEKKCVDAGKGFGYVNDVVVCTDPLKPTEGKGKSSTTVKSNNDGTKTQTKTDTSVKCEGGVCTTTTTTTNTAIGADGTKGDSTTSIDTKSTGGGGVPGSGGSGLDKNDSFCQENPNSPMCKSGSFSGSCGAEPVCDGDPVQCATARAVFKSECKQPALGDLSTIPNSGVGEDIGQRKIDSMISYSSLGSSGACPSPRSVTVLGKSVSMDYSAFCGFSNGIRAIVLLMAWVAAGYIVFGVGGKNA